MLTSVKSALSRSTLARNAWTWSRSQRDRRQAATQFENADDYLHALRRKGEGEVVLRTHDGLQISIRRNLWDAEIVREMFFQQPYTRHVDLPDTPVVVDIGGYIGDFSLYAVNYLGATRVVTYEPTAENMAILRRNIDLNGYADRITAVGKAVGPAGELLLNVQALDAGEMHASSHWYPEAEQRRIPSVTLDELFAVHDLEHIDLLKVDCEGGEYEIFAEATDQALQRVRNIVFEWHEVDNYRELLDRVRRRLTTAGFSLRTDRHIVTGVAGATAGRAAS
jgi:FkbM family methyltransferase